MERLFAVDNSQFLEPITRVIYKDILKQYMKNGEKIALVGLNYYGAILASVIGYKYNFPFTYYFHDRSFVDEIENELQEIESNHLIIITDVMVFGKTICKLVDYLGKNNLLDDNTRIEIVVLFERKIESDYIAYAYLHPQIKEINILNDDFCIEICKKDRTKCLFVQNENMCQYKKARF